MVDETTGEVTLGAPAAVGGPAAVTYRRSEQIELLFAALCKAQAMFANAEKLGENPHFRSRYATLEAVLDATKQGRAEQGLAVIQMPVNWATGIAVTTLLGHTSGQWIESTIWVPPAKLDAQGAGSVITYLRRYALMAVLGIAAEDDDGESASRQQTAPDGARRPAQQPSNPNQLASKEQRMAVWATIKRTIGDEHQAEKWMDSERMQFKPPILKSTEMTVAHLRTIIEHLEAYKRGEESQEREPGDEEEPDDEFGFDTQAGEPVSEPRDEMKAKDDKGKKKGKGK